MSNGEFNIFVDPGAAARVLTTLPPGGMTFVPLDATNFVPVEPDLVDRLLDAAHTPGAAVVGTLDGWYVLSAVAAVHPHVVTYESLELTEIGDGPGAGRTALDPNGRGAHVATQAPRQEFERLLFDALDGE